MRVLPYAAGLLGLALGCQPPQPVNVRPDYDTASLQMKVVLIDESPPQSMAVPLPPPRFMPDEPRGSCPRSPVQTYWQNGNWHWNGATWVWARGYCYRGEDPGGVAGGPFLLFTKELAELKLKFYKAAYSAGRYRPAFWRQEVRVDPPKVPEPPPPPVQLPPPRTPSDPPAPGADPAATQAPAPAPAPAQTPAAPPAANP